MSYEPYTGGPFGEPRGGPRETHAAPYTQAYSGQRGFTPTAGRANLTLGRVVQVVLGASALVTIYHIVTLFQQHSIAGRIIAGDRSVTLHDAQAADSGVSHSGQLELGVLALTALVFLVWFWRARTDADGYDPHVQRRARPWAFWAWFCPVVNLWFPYQIALDTLRGCTEPTYDRSAGYHRYPWVRAWWLVFILAGVLDRVAAAHPGGTLQQLRGRIEVDITASVVEVIAAALAIVVVGQISLADERRRTLLLAG